MVATSHNWLQVVLLLRDRTSTVTTTVHQPVATATEFPVFASWVGLGCSLFLVGETGPSKTTYEQLLVGWFVGAPLIWAAQCATVHIRQVLSSMGHMLLHIVTCVRSGANNAVLVPPTCQLNHVSFVNGQI